MDCDLSNMSTGRRASNSLTLTASQQHVHQYQPKKKHPSPVKPVVLLYAYIYLLATLLIFLQKLYAISEILYSVPLYVKAILK